MQEKLENPLSERSMTPMTLREINKRVRRRSKSQRRGKAKTKSQQRSTLA